jgi:hypothetical protein
MSVSLNSRGHECQSDLAKKPLIISYFSKLPWFCVQDLSFQAGYKLKFSYLLFSLQSDFAYCDFSKVQEDILTGPLCSESHVCYQWITLCSILLPSNTPVDLVFAFYIWRIGNLSLRYRKLHGLQLPINSSQLFAFLGNRVSQVFAASVIESHLSLSRLLKCVPLILFLLKGIFCMP